MNTYERSIKKDPTASQTNSVREDDDHETFNPPILATQFLERLGYRLSDTGIVNEGISLKILAVEHEDGTPADFASNMYCSAGVVLPHPFKYYADWADDDEDDSEEERED